MSGIIAVVPTAHADSVMLYGVQFSADDIKTIDAATVQVRMGIDTRILNRSDSTDFIVKHSLQNASQARRLPLLALEQFVTLALADHHDNRALWGLQAIVHHYEPEPRAVASYLETCQKNETMLDLLKQLVTEEQVKFISPAVMAKLLVLIGETDSGWLTTEYQHIELATQALVREEVRARIFSALSNKDFTTATSMLAAQKAIAGTEDPSYRTLQVVSSRLHVALETNAEGDTQPLFALWESQHADKEITELLAPLVFEAVHSAASGSLAKNDPDKALELLSKLDFDRRTPTTHELAKKALSMMPTGGESALGDSQVSRFLAALSGVDPAVRDQYLAAMERQIEALVRSGRPDAAGDYIAKIGEVRPDPNAANDALRLDQAFGFIHRGMPLSAKESISRMQTGLGIVGRARLLLSGYYGNPLYWALVLLVPIVLYLIARVRRPAVEAEDVEFEKASRGRARSRDWKEDGENEEDEADRPVGFKVFARNLMTPSMLEYNRCLEVFGMKPGTPIAEVKRRYRTLIKSVHPDLNDHLTNQEKDRFLLLTKTYDRFLELRKDMKMND